MLRLRQIASIRERDVIGVFVLVETRLYREGIARAVDEDDRFNLAGTADGVAGAIAEIGSIDLPEGRQNWCRHSWAQGLGGSVA